MDIKNHAKMVSLELGVEKKLEASVDVVISPVDEDVTLQVVHTPSYSTPNTVILQGDTNSPILFSTMEPIYGNASTNSLDGTDPDDLYVYSLFMRKLISGYIGSTVQIPKMVDDSYGGLLPSLFRHVKNSDGTYGINMVTKEELSDILKAFPNNNICEGRHGENVIREDWLYLPIVNSEMEGGSSCIFDRFPKQCRTAIRKVINLSSSRTYTRILLRDRTEYTLWYNKNFLIIISEN